MVRGWSEGNVNDCLSLDVPSGFVKNIWLYYVRYLIEGKTDIFEDEYLYRKFGLVVMKFISIANI